jgi:hypothetical protein
MKKSIKPRISMRKLIVLAMVFLIIPMFQGCDDAEDIAEILDNIEYFQFDYKIVPSGTTTTSTAIALIEAEDAIFLTGMSRFVPATPSSGGTGASNIAQVFGNPTQAGSSFQMIMERESTNDLAYVRSIAIQSPQGPFFEGQILTTAIVDLQTGLPSSGKSFNSNLADTQVRVIITSINTIAKKFGGEFYFVLRDTNNPATSDFLAGAEGTFLFNY